MKKYIEISATTMYETDEAVMFETDEDLFYWIPKSLIEDRQWPEIGDSGDINVEEWFAIKEGLV